MQKSLLVFGLILGKCQAPPPPAALGALSSPRGPVLLRALKESIAQFHGGGFDLCPVSFSFHFPLFPLSSLVSEAISQRPFIYLQPSSRLEAAAVMGMVRHFGHGIFHIWVSGFLCSSGYSSDAAHFLCRCTLFCYIWNFFYMLLNPITWFCAQSSL